MATSGRRQIPSILPNIFVKRFETNALKAIGLWKLFE